MLIRCPRLKGAILKSILRTGFEDGRGPTVKLLSQASIYGIRAALYVASVEREEPYVPVRQIAEHLQISYHFLAKVLQTLTQHNILISYRGPNGGVALARPADQIRLIDMVAAIDGIDFFEGCVLGLPGCGEQEPCPLHAQWGLMRDSIKYMFENATLATLGERIREGGIRIAPIGLNL